MRPTTFRTIGCALLLAGAVAMRANAQETTGNPAGASPKTPGADIGTPAPGRE